LGSKAIAATQRGGAIVSDISGTTRDRRECWGRLGTFEFRLLDTAGIDSVRLKHSIRKPNLSKAGSSVSTFNTDTDTNTNTKLTDKTAQKYDNDNSPWVLSQMMQQTLEAAQNSHAILLVMDAKVGITSDWIQISKWLRRSIPKQDTQSIPIPNKQKVIVVANKLEGDAWNYDGSPVWDHLWELENAGFGSPIAISALHGEGMADLAIALIEIQKKYDQFQNIPIEDSQHDDTDSDSHDEEEKETPQKDSKDTAIKEKPLQMAILGRQNVGKVSHYFDIMPSTKLLILLDGYAFPSSHVTIHQFSHPPL
jgi:predicted GTPase